MYKKIQEIENLNYGLYIFISLVLGITLFVSFFITGTKMTEVVMDVMNTNEVDRLYTYSKADSRGFDINFKSDIPYKIKYYIGTNPENLMLFIETSDFVTEDIQQFRSLMPSDFRFLQIVVEDRDGNLKESSLKEINGNVVK
jgi:hypothetical protein